MLSHEVKERVESGLEGSTCIVNEFSGGNDHYAIIVITQAFEGKSLLIRHRMVMDLFKAEMATEEVHALTIKAFTPSQWEEERSIYERAKI